MKDEAADSLAGHYGIDQPPPCPHPRPDTMLELHHTDTTGLRLTRPLHHFKDKDKDETHCTTRHCQNHNMGSYHFHAFQPPCEDPVAGTDEAEVRILIN